MRKEFIEPKVEILDFEISEIEGIATSDGKDNSTNWKDGIWD